ncbi:MAG: DsbE family thiol:disulfide interchange protein [Pseudomonadota bacterium]|nr:DsbE family thiol:disulfide interchange protein [Pseudomonadota bacterium]
MNKAFFYIPLLVFVFVVGFFLAGLGLDNRNELPSALLDKAFPDFQAEDLFDPQRTVRREDLVGGGPLLVNVWATWCPTCAQEHEMLIRIAERAHIKLVGINYKDERTKALSWLAQFGNPYDLVLYDEQGLLGVELGVYGAPETFLVSPEGDIVYKRVGDVNETIWREELLPRLLSMNGSVVKVAHANQ